MDPRPRKAINLLAMGRALRDGLRYLIAIPTLVAIVVVACFQIIRADYVATANFSTPTSVYQRLNSADFQLQVSAESEKRGISSSDITSGPVISSQGSDGDVSVSYTSPNQDAARTMSAIFAELSSKIAEEQNTETYTNRQLEKKIELSVTEEYNNRITQIFDAVIQKIKTADYPVESDTSSGDIAKSVEAYMAVLEQFRKSEIYLRTEQFRLDQAVEQFETSLPHWEVSSSSTAKYKLAPVLLASVLVTLLLVGAFLIAKSALLRSSGEKREMI